MERPKHLADGAKQGAFSALAGVGAGLASLVVFPLQGAKEGGAKGAALGVGKGVGAFVGLSVLGVGAGVVQVVRGAVNTPEAVKAKIKGKEWDKRTHRWVFYNMADEASLVLNMDETTYLEYLRSGGSLNANEGDSSASHEDGKHGEASSAQGATGSRQSPTKGEKKEVKETELYDALNVAPDATPAQIKKAYYRLAKECHPDKNPDDETAKERFQHISQAYQVLSDEELRSKYDNGGSSAMDASPKMDAKAFYTMMFGSEEFEPLIGKMDVLRMMGIDDESDEKPPDGMSDEVFEFARVELSKWKREVTCAMNLADLLEPFVSGALDKEGFRSRMQTLGEELSSSAVGGALVGCIGYCYKQQAVRQLGDSAVSGGVIDRLLGAKASGEHKVHAAKKYAVAGMAGIAAARCAISAESAADTDQADAKQARAAAKMVEAMWHTTVIEIESLLAIVCRKVTHDTGVDKELRRKRAEALVIAGTVFLGCSAKADGGAMEELMLKLGNVTGEGPSETPP